jgi:hypothetical protein
MLKLLKTIDKSHGYVPISLVPGVHSAAAPESLPPAMRAAAGAAGGNGSGGVAAGAAVAAAAAQLDRSTEAPEERLSRELGGRLAPVGEESDSDG